MKKLEGKSQDVLVENVSKIKELFPEVFEEGKINFDYLKKVLGDFTDSENEKYSFTWNGKSDAIKTALRPTSATLRPDKESSKDWDNTDNLFIEGDNLEVLKILQDTYRNKIKMIYLDPPYNTGHDFVYNDNFDDSIIDYIEKTNQSLISNADTGGRYHTNWLNMMYPRLRLARNLLKDDGAIFISIDDNEIVNLRKVCDEIFGEDNFINIISVKMSEMKGAKLAHVGKKFPKIKEYLVIYCKNKDFFKLNPVKIEKTQEELEGYLKYYGKRIKNINEKCENWVFEKIEMSFDEKIKNAESLIYLVAPDQEKNISCPNNSFCEIENTIGGINYFYNDNGTIKTVLFLSNYIETYLGDLWLDISTININKENYSIPTYANGQKPIDLMLTILRSFIQDNDIVLDFFAGSGTTADAVLRFNSQKGKSNSFIMVQIPEKIEIIAGMDAKTKKTTQQLIDFLEEINKPKILTEIGYERIRRAGEKIKQDNNGKEGIDKLDIGFKAFKLDSTNLTLWDEKTKDLQGSLLEQVNSVKSDRKVDDVLYEILLKYGIDLSTPITEEKINNKKVYSIAGGYLLICLEKDIDLETISKIAEKKPQRVVFYDHGFKDDMVKINAEQTLKKAGIEDIRII